MGRSRRGWFLTTVAVLFVLVAISNLLKPVLADAQTGFVFFGHRLSGLANDILGPLFGAILLTLAILIWRMQHLALPLAWIYSAYVASNVILFAIVDPGGAAVPGGVSTAHGRMILSVTFAAVGIGVPLATSVVLTRRKAELQ